MKNRPLFPFSRGRAVLAGLLILSFCVGCSSSKQTAAKPAKKPSREYEKEFDPRKYDPKERTARPPEAKKNPAPEPKEQTPAPVERMERITGFRVQIFSTPDLDEAVRTKTTSQSLLDSMKVYMVYDAPYYKIRVGDYVTKTGADSARETLRGRGFNDAWIVPDQVNVMVTGAR